MLIFADTNVHLTIRSLLTPCPSQFSDTFSVLTFRPFRPSRRPYERARGAFLIVLPNNPCLFVEMSQTDAHLAKIVLMIDPIGHRAKLIEISANAHPEFM